MKDAYYFGSLAKRLDLFAFPRTGAHFFTYCFSGLFDQVSLPHEYLHFPEAVDRQAELRDSALYALELRENGAPYCPVWLNALANGLHGVPAKGDYPALLLVRDPIATAYSFYRVSPRWGTPIPDVPAWLQQTFNRYMDFYRAGFDMVAQHPQDTLPVRFEALVAGPEALRQVVEFVGLRPKLAPEFVYSITRFENFARPGQRTFYREGHNDAWRRDAQWVEALRQLPNLDFRPFGYAPLAESLGFAEQ